MKRILALFIAAMLLLGLAGCRKTEIRCFPTAGKSGEVTDIQAPKTEEKSEPVEEATEEKEDPRHNSDPDEDGGHEYSIDKIAAAGDYVYYEKGGGIYRLEVSGRKQTTVTLEGELLGAGDEWVYYNEKGAAMAARPGETPIRLLESDGYLKRTDNDLFLDSEDGLYLLEGSQLKKIPFNEAYTALSLEGDTLYWVQHITGGSALYRTDLQTGEKTELGRVGYSGGKPRMARQGDRLYYAHGNGLYCYTEAEGLQTVKEYETDQLCFFANGRAYFYRDNSAKPNLEVFDLATGQSLRAEEIVPGGFYCHPEWGVAYYLEDQKKLVAETPERKEYAIDATFGYVEKVIPTPDGFFLQYPDQEGCFLCGDCDYLLFYEQEGELLTEAY